MLNFHLCLLSSGFLGSWVLLGMGESGVCLLMEVVDTPSPGMFKPGWMGL